MKPTTTSSECSSGGTSRAIRWPDRVMRAYEGHTLCSLASSRQGPTGGKAASVLRGGRASRPCRKLRLGLQLKGAPRRSARALHRMLPNAPSAARCALRRPAASPSVSSWIRRSTPLRSLAPHTIASRGGAVASPALPVPLRRPASTAARPRRNVDSPLSRPPPSHPVSSANHASHKPLKRTDIKLRPYQVDCIRAVLDELERGEFSRLGVSAPTGASPWPSPNACCAPTLNSPTLSQARARRPSLPRSSRTSPRWSTRSRARSRPASSSSSTRSSSRARPPRPSRGHTQTWCVPGGAAELFATSARALPLTHRS